jgi:hypothetical protein
MANNEYNTTPEENSAEVQSSLASESVGQAEEPTACLEPDQFDHLKSEQNLMGGILGGFIGAIVGAALWAVVTAITKYQIGYMAIGVGFITGFMVKKLGQGVEKHFGFIGAAWSLVGCFVGNITAILIMISNDASIPFMAILPQLNIDVIIEITKETFDPRDLLFYGIALYEGYRFSFLTANEISSKLCNMTNREAA